MAKVGVSLKINCSQIDKARLFSGQKGQYLDATVFIDLDQLDQYGNSGMITQDVSKEEKQQNVKGNILGNCKVFWRDEQQAGQQVNAPQYGKAQQAPPKFISQDQQQAVGGFHQQAPKVNPQEPTIDFDGDIPF